VLVRLTVQTSACPAPPGWVQLVTEALTCAELVNDPNRPNTNPAMAIAAMSVMAISITVARTGEIAFLRFVLLIFMVAYSPKTKQMSMELMRRWTGLLTQPLGNQ